jgi:hypothetical protein
LGQNPISFEKKPHFPAYAIRFSAEYLPFNTYKGVAEGLMLMEILGFFREMPRQLFFLLLA